MPAELSGMHMREITERENHYKKTDNGFRRRTKRESEESIGKA